MGADWWRENQVRRESQETKSRKPRRALRWAQQAGLQGADSHQQSRSQSGSGNHSGDMSARPSTEGRYQSLAGQGFGIQQEQTWHLSNFAQMKVAEAVAKLIK